MRKAYPQNGTSGKKFPPPRKRNKGKHRNEGCKARHRLDFKTGNSNPVHSVKEAFRHHLGHHRKRDVTRKIAEAECEETVFGSHSFSFLFFQRRSSAS